MECIGESEAGFAGCSVHHLWQKERGIVDLTRLSLLLPDNLWCSNFFQEDLKQCSVHICVYRRDLTPSLLFLKLFLLTFLSSSLFSTSLKALPVFISRMLRSLAPNARHREERPAFLESGCDLHWDGQQNTFIWKREKLGIVALLDEMSQI